MTTHTRRVSRNIVYWKLLVKTNMDLCAYDSNMTRVCRVCKLGVVISMVYVSVTAVEVP